MKKIRNVRDMVSTTKYTLLDMIFLIIVFSLLSIIITTFIYKKQKQASDTNNIDNVYNQIVDYYYEDVNKEELANSAINGMMNYLDEKYSLYMDEGRTSVFNEQLDGTYKGIGVVASQNKDGIFIKNVMSNSPAEKSGIQVDDQLLKVDDIEVNDDTKLDDIIAYIKEHEDMVFYIKRNDSELVINIKTDDIPNPVVSTKLLSNDKDNYGYIYLQSFTNNSYNQFKSSLEEIEKNDIKGLIIDVRSNKGGYIDHATNIAELFLNKNKIVYRIKEKDKESIIKDSTDESRNYPVVVLVDKITASSSELLALALKESYGAIIVGSNTYGKGRVQFKSQITDNTMIKYTSGVWYSPNNNSIDGVGIKPSYTIDLSKDYYKNPSDKNDNQLTKALSVLIDLNK